MKLKMKSKCCKAETEVGGMGDFHDADAIVTCYNVCKSCKQPCDFYEENPVPEAQRIDIKKLQRSVDELRLHGLELPRPAFLVDDKLRESAKKAAAAFAEEQKALTPPSREEFEALNKRLDEQLEILNGITARYDDEVKRIWIALSVLKIT